MTEIANYTRLYHINSKKINQEVNNLANLLTEWGYGAELRGISEDYIIVVPKMNGSSIKIVVTGLNCDNHSLEEVAKDMFKYLN